MTQLFSEREQTIVVRAQEHMNALHHESNMVISTFRDEMTSMRGMIAYHERGEAELGQRVAHVEAYADEMYEQHCVQSRSSENQYESNVENSAGEHVARMENQYKSEVVELRQQNADNLVAFASSSDATAEGLAREIKRLRLEAEHNSQLHSESPMAEAASQVEVSQWYDHCEWCAEELCEENTAQQYLTLQLWEIPKKKSRFVIDVQLACPSRKIWIGMS